MDEKPKNYRVYKGEESGFKYTVRKYNKGSGLVYRYLTGTLTLWGAKLAIKRDKKRVEKLVYETD